MLPIYHILGSEIEHHNQRVLTFFQQELLPLLSDSEHFFYVVGKPSLQADFPHLRIERFPSQKAVANALIAKKRQNPTACFLLHGQFNPWIWLAIALGRLPTTNLIWHIWGADLYEMATSWKFKLFYPLRRVAQQKITQVWATRGDLDHLWRNVRARSEQDRLIYFPTKLGDQTEISTAQNDRLTILLGNSGDPANDHIQALSEIHQRLGNDVQIIMPMGYPENNENYIRQVEAYSERLFLAENLQILRQKLSFEEYAALLSHCDLGYFNFKRQQGIGTISLLISHNVPCVLHSANPFGLDLQAEKVPYLLAENLTASQIQTTKQQLKSIDKNRIAFFAPGYTKLWQQRLIELMQNE